MATNTPLFTEKLQSYESYSASIEVFWMTQIGGRFAKVIISRKQRMRFFVVEKYGIPTSKPRLDYKGSYPNCDSTYAGLISYPFKQFTLKRKKKHKLEKRRTREHSRHDMT